VSWNGATSVASWRVLGGPGAAGSYQLSPLGTAARKDFETTITIPSVVPNVQVQALNRKGTVIGTSRITPVAGA
jgi:hypothetical protein